MFRRHLRRASSASTTDNIHDWTDVAELEGQHLRPMHPTPRKARFLCTTLRDPTFAFLLDVVLHDVPDWLQDKAIGASFQSDFVC